MNARRWILLCFGAGLVFLSVGIGLRKSQAAPPGPSELDVGVEVLTRGPVHEAFAEIVTFDPEPGIVVPKAPPELIEELPPEQMPEGTNVAWIPGYWGWDDERHDFLWISGIWRDLPPGRQWMPGYWGESGQGYQWTSGYWADAAASETQYLPEPPATVESGPNIAASSADQIWAPGCWIWNQNRYAWQPGYWATAQPDWTWVPAHYIWAPRGYVFVNGYYDHSVDRRGVLFAPVYFNANVYSQPGFSYSPATVINPAVFASQLFLRPHFQHYYFGDYYAANYSGAGYHPWFSYNSGRQGYDPIYAQQRWSHRQDQGWEQNVQADFQHRRDHEDARPPRTWAAQRALMSSQVNSPQKSFVIAAPLEQLARSKESPLQFRQVDQNGQQSLAKHRNEYQKFRQERQQSETSARSGVGSSPQSEPARAKLSRSPIFAKPANELGKNQAPPQVPQTPQVDSQFEPKPRVARSPNQPQPRTTNRLPLDGAEPQSGKVPPLRPGSKLPSTQPQPQPRIDPPASQPKPKVNRPDSQPQPQPKLNRPDSQPQPPPKLNRPDPQPQPKLNRPDSQPQPQPKLNRPDSQPQPPPKLNRPDSQPQPPPKLNRPDPQPQLKVNRSAPRPQPENQINPPQSPPRVNSPASQRQPTANRPDSRPQPQRQTDRPQSQLKVDQPSARPQVKATDRLRGSAGPPSAGSRSEKPRSKEKD